MTIKEGLDISGWKTIIPDTARRDLPQFFLDMGFKKGVEIGVWKGKFGIHLAKAGLEVYGIDCYQSYDDCLVYGKQNYLDDAYRKAQKRLKDHPNYKIVKKFSMDAVNDFEDESLDFVYIDGNHEFKFVTEDIHEWSKKVKKGGVISGHDYITLGPPGYCDVKHVIDAYVACKKLEKWYVLGRKHAKPGEKRDRERSWFWFKS